MKSWAVAVTVILIGLIAVTYYFTLEGTADLVFGWLVFPARTVTRVQMDWPSAALGGVALVLFVAGLHAVARAAFRPHGVVWKLRWSLTSALLVVLAFTAGIAIIGTIHQVGWLATAREPALVNSAQLYQARSSTNLRDVGFSFTNANALPKGGTFAGDGTMLHSWETAVLDTGYSGYFANFDRSKPWNDPANEATFKSVFPLFINPELRGAPIKDADGYGLSHYAANSRVMAGNYAAPMAELEGHTSTTILIGEVNAKFRPWGHPVNWRDPARGINRSPDGFGGRPGTGGAHFLMADGSVRFLSERTSPEVLRALASPKREDKCDPEALQTAIGTGER
jgi:prepilin-type processing-associated H-X9-DG protein